MVAQQNISLRDYQKKSIEGLRNLIRKGHRRVLLCCPTGGGKTVIASSMIHSALERGSRSLFLAHRRELIDQTYEKLERFGVKSGVIMGSDPRRDDYLPTQVASVQTLIRRLDRKPKVNVIFVDECHHAASETYKKIIEAYPDAIVIGMTATPWRGDRLGLGDIYEDMVLACTPAELIAMGALVPFDVFAYDAPDLHDIGVVAGEFNQRDLGIACNTKVLVGAIVKEYVTHAAGRRAIVFPVNVAHSLHLVDEFRAAGFNAMHVDCNTDKDIRKDAMDRFRYGDVTILSSVGVLTEGFDAPAAEVCIMARPTKSLALYIQMGGRVLRTSPETGKKRALIHDHAGNTLRHGFLDDERDYSLQPTQDRIRALHTCPNCHTVFASLKNGRCPGCDELIAVPDERSSSSNGEGRDEHEVVDGRRISRAEIEKIRGRREELGLERDLTDRQIARAAMASRQEKAAEYLRLQQLAEKKGFKKGFIGHQFRGTFAHWPKFTEEELAAASPAERPFFPLPRKNA